MGVPVEFWINDERVSAGEPRGLLVLDYLRERRGLAGTKEGCKEGDCGACCVMIGTLDQGTVSYELVTSCLVPLGEMHGKHVVTVEGLNGDELNFVQSAMVDQGGTQCGYCTPGFIMAMSWYMMCETEEPSLERFRRAISGNLCRCTGYCSILRAGSVINRFFEEAGPGREIWDSPDRIGALSSSEMIPAYFTRMVGRLGEIAAHPASVSLKDGVLGIAGGTDLYVQRGEDIPDSDVALLGGLDGFRGVRLQGECLHVGALTSFEAFGQDARVRELVPEMDRVLYLIASLPLRNRATLSGNIVNASPIGDMTILLMALGGTLVLQDGDASRQVELRNFYSGYKQFDKRPEEIVTEIRIPVSDGDTSVGFEKVSKRETLDIASVNSACRIRVVDGMIREAAITVGGVAPVPLFARAASAALVDRPLDVATVRQMLILLQSEVSPISDIRGSAQYKRLLAHQLVLAHFLRLYPETFRFEEFSD
jgi:xanthine dehydrogenase small subunit